MVLRSASTVAERLCRKSEQASAAILAKKHANLNAFGSRHKCNLQTPERNTKKVLGLANTSRGIRRRNKKSRIEKCHNLT